MQKALSPSINNELSTGVQSTERIHRNDLPAPAGYREMTRHSLQHLFCAAMELELSTLEPKRTWRIESHPDNVFVIPTIWVFTYKFDDNGYLKRVKARICVQGNKQIMTHDDTTAAALASKCFRLMMALTAAFNLEIKQYDAPNAFVNSELDELVYVAPPPGRMRKEYTDSRCTLRLNRALYGLRCSPRLWQRDFSSTMRKLGLEPVNEEPCLFIGHGVIVLVYVEDIFIFYLPNLRTKRIVLPNL